jgi:phenylalanine-4-hydroxylase
VEQNGDLKIYGGGILSSPGETLYALDDERPLRQAFSVDNVLRTPYRIDIMQPTYFVLDDIRQLYELKQQDLSQDVARAMESGLLPPLFEPKDMTHA